MSPEYWTSRRLTELRLRLSERDEAVLRALARVRMATGAQLCRLLFDDLASSERQCRRALTRLVRLGVIVRLDRTAGGRGGGSQSHPYALDIAGQRLAHLTDTHDRPRSVWPISPAFRRHALAVTELYVRLMESNRHGGRDVLEFQAEPWSWRPFTTPGGGRSVLKPDAFVRLSSGEKFEDAWFVEIDMDTEHRPALERKLAVYFDHLASGREQESHGGYPQVLWLVPSATRRQLIEAVIKAQPKQLHRIHVAELFDVGARLMQEDRHDAA